MITSSIIVLINQRKYESFAFYQTLAYLSVSLLSVPVRFYRAYCSISIISISSATVKLSYLQAYLLSTRFQYGHIRKSNLSSSWFTVDDMNTIELNTNNMIHDSLLQCWLIVCVLLQWAVSWRAARRGSEVCYAQSRPRPRSRAAASHP